MKSQDTKSSKELKKEVERELDRVTDDIDEIESRLTPGQIIDSAIFSSTNENLTSTLGHLKRNPVGTTFLSLGTILLMEDDKHRTLEQRSRSKLAQASQKVQGEVDSLKESARSLKGDLENKVQDVKQKFQKNEDPGIQDKSVVDEAKENVSAAYSEGKEKIQNLDPYTYVAMGMGLGSITGASIPISDTEEKFFDDNLRGKFSELSKDLQEAINESTNVLKDLVLSDLKDKSFRVFK